MQNVVLDESVIGRCFFLEDTLVDADIALVFGMNDCARPVARALELYRSGQARRLLFTGGYNKNLGASEAETMAALARRSGLPEQAILIEPRAINTEENVAFALALLEAHSGLAGLRSVALVTIHYHLRRAILAARRALPASVALGWASYPSRYYSASDWHQSARGRADIASEIDKIRTYYALSLNDLAHAGP